MSCLGVVTNSPNCKTTHWAFGVIDGPTDGAKRLLRCLPSLTDWNCVQRRTHCSLTT